MDCLITAVGACDGFACTFFNTLSWRDETSPLPHLLGPVPGGIAAKLILVAAIGVVMVAFRCRPRTKAALLALYTVAGVVGAASGAMVG